MTKWLNNGEKWFRVWNEAIRSNKKYIHWDCRSLVSTNDTMELFLCWLLVSDDMSLSAKKHGRQNRSSVHSVFPTFLFYVYVNQ